MPWKEQTVEQSRLEFVVAAISGERPISQLCREYGISRPTGYKWIDRYMAGEDLGDRDHTALRQPNRTPPEAEELILATRTKHPTWGGRKIVRYLQNQGHQQLPAASTATMILKRHGMISPEESEKHTPYIRFEREAPNRLWQMDFKGHFAMTNGERCHPLTMLDDCTRTLLCLDAYDNERWNVVEKSLLWAFREHGLPDAILSDNGSPWSDNQQGYTPYEIWMMQLEYCPCTADPCTLRHREKRNGSTGP